MTDKIVECNSCGWSGNENELEVEFYEEQISPMPIATICPDCKNDIDK